MGSEGLLHAEICNQDLQGTRSEGGWVEHCFWSINSILTGSQLPLHPPCDCFLTPGENSLLSRTPRPSPHRSFSLPAGFQSDSVRSCLGTCPGSLSSGGAVGHGALVEGGGWVEGLMLEPSTSATMAEPLVRT